LLPCAASAWAVAFPIPWVAPVTITIFSAIRPDFSNILTFLNLNWIGFIMNYNIIVNEYQSCLRFDWFEHLFPIFPRDQS
jgi:hypothetical protein